MPIASIAPGVFLPQGGAIALLPLVGRHSLGALACIMGFGLGFGVAALATPALLLDRYGPVLHTKRMKHKLILERLRAAYRRRG